MLSNQPLRTPSIKSELTLGALAALLVFLCCLSYLYPTILYVLAGPIAIAFLLKCLVSPKWTHLGILLSLHLGILTSVKIGFTLRGPQFFALLSLIYLTVSYIFRLKPEGEKPPWAWQLPFILFFISLLPSFFLTDFQYYSLTKSTSSLRLMFNLSLLYGLAYVLLTYLDTKTKLIQAIKWSFVSCALSLGFGFMQQFGYYTQRYSPFDFIGKHSSIVDFYGPFLRISPGTFANEYGQILQSVGLCLLGSLLLTPQIYKGRQRIWAWGLFIALSCALIINFTRASWFIFTGFGFYLLWQGKVKMWILILLGILMAMGLQGLMIFSDILGEYNLFLSVGERFEELGDLASASAGLRLEAWGRAWEAFLKQPWTGHGLGIFVDTHNVPLQLLAESGIIGLGGYIYLMAWILWTQIRGYITAKDQELKQLQQIFILIFLGCLAFDLTNHGLFHFVFWFAIALGLALARLNLSSESNTRYSIIKSKKQGCEQ